MSLWVSPPASGVDHRPKALPNGDMRLLSDTIGTIEGWPLEGSPAAHRASRAPRLTVALYVSIIANLPILLATADLTMDLCQRLVPTSPAIAAPGGEVNRGPPSFIEALDYIPHSSSHRLALNT